MSNGLSGIDGRLAAFRRKYYLNLFIRGSLLTASLVLLYYLVAAVIEYNLWLGSWGRLLLLAMFIAIVAFSIFRFLRQPLSWWIYRKGLGEEESARMIGAHFPTVKDKLLNLIQLSAIRAGNPLIEAGMLQKASQLESVPFETAIDLRDNRKYLRYFLIPLGIILALLLFDRSIFTQSTQRIIQFNREFSPQAPFRFELQNETLMAFINEDFTLDLQINGEAVPSSVYIVAGPQRYKMEALSDNKFTYTFERIQNELTFQFEGSGFLSEPHTISLINRPELTQLKVTFEYPRYLGKANDQMINAGNLEVPEGTRISWQIHTSNAERAAIGFSAKQEVNDMQMTDNQSFIASKQLMNPDGYWIELENAYSKNKDQITYSIGVIKDQYPQIVVDNLRDSILFKNIMLGGSIADDYGLTALNLHYQVVSGQNVSSEKVRPISINRQQLRQGFYYRWSLDSLTLKPGDKVNYYLEVWDNDGVNGRKATRSSAYVFQLPNREDIKTDITKSQGETESQIDQSLQKAQDLKEAIEEAQQKLRGKQTLDWQDKKMLEDLVKQRSALDQLIKDLQKQNELLDQKKDAFTEQNEKIKEKSEQIQKLMDELLDDETRKLFEELEKLLRENSDINQIQKMLDQMNRKEINLEKELERTLELFKQMKFDYKLEEAINEIKEQIEKQEELLEDTQDLAGEKKDSQKKEGENHEKGDEKSEESGQSKEQKGAEQLAQEQEELSKKAEDFKETVEELNQLGDELDQQVSSPSEEEIGEMQQQQQQSKESLEQGKPKKATESQKKALEQMREMKNQLQGMQNSMEMEMDMANLESLRQIIHGLIKLSYDQEAIMKDFGSVQQTDPKYVTLGQQQLKIKDDAKVLEDSLLSLAKKDPFMGSIVTREVGELNDHVDKAVENIRERRKGNAGAEMQLAMTSINNLALMLNDHFDMMMQMMANAKPGGKPGKKSSNQSLGEMQQMLNQQIEQLKNSGKTGRQLSEELAKLAAEQERIRRALREMQEKLEQQGGKVAGDDLPGKMEQTEMELVNKQLTEETIRRQREIVTRLLEAEKSMREQNMDEERKGETAKDYQKEFPRAFEEYLRLKEKEVELLKTVPPKLYPYYKKEVNEYFKRIENLD